MKLHVDQEGCISCGLCVTICPEVFRMNEEDKYEVTVSPVPEELEAEAGEAMESCPVAVIGQDD